jgi:REP element-mobilizing transposase RayT
VGAVKIQTMPEHKHLKRLDRIWITNPRYFITVCTENRRPILASEETVSVLRKEWEAAMERHGWAVGSYVVMPDHVHFFCTDGEQGVTLSEFVGKWKEWTAKALKQTAGLDGHIWQSGFFDHLLRSSESYSEKWEYVQNNPVHVGLVKRTDDWPYRGHIHYR